MEQLRASLAQISLMLAEGLLSADEAAALKANELAALVPARAWGGLSLRAVTVGGSALAQVPAELRLEAKMA